VLLPAFVKTHGHDHEQPLIGVAKDQPLSAWLDHAVNPFTRFLRDQRDALSDELGCTPHLATYRMARVSDIHYGITTSMVHHCNYNKYHLADIAAANEAAGTTMIVAVGSQDRNYVAELLDEPDQALARLDAASSSAPLRARASAPAPISCSPTAARCSSRSRTGPAATGPCFTSTAPKSPRPRGGFAPNTKRPTTKTRASCPRSSGSR